ncbi:golgi snap receptor complex member [Anaeramoeba flamelloides]|uniref:Golgi snap receptor complex member n=1 Tax=Anaeramoeba flamelloides TaxID=1746091 RepID=A0AAV7ZG94_9EUKA|nr:golgi snap receptor complex member [Anaeramoeba flamelloides]
MSFQLNKTDKTQNLKGQIQNLRNRLEIKMARFSKYVLSDKYLGSKVDNLFEEDDLDQENIRLLDQPDIEQNNNLSKEIRYLIRKLEEAIDALELHSQSSKSNELFYQIQRNQQILLSFKSEYQKDLLIMKEKKEKYDLFNGRSNKSKNTSAQINLTTENLLKERTSLVGSTKAMDNILGQAGAVHTKTKHQGATFKNIGSKMGTATSKFPTVNTIIQKIKAKKNRDNLILGTLVAICLIILVWYWWTK